MLNRRERVREATCEEIKRVARQQMAEQGAAALSLRAIAGEMGLTPPALYRYYKSRDDLVTALILDAYNTMADTLEAARDAHTGVTTGARLAAIMLAYREWALARPAEFSLILGTPIPNYHAPEDVTTPAARRSLVIFMDLLLAAWHAGEISPTPEEISLSPELHAQLEDWMQAAGVDVPVPVLHMTLAGWVLMQGLISLEVFGHMGALVGDPGTLYRYEIGAMLTRLGLR